MRITGFIMSAVLFVFLPIHTKTTFEPADGKAVTAQFAVVSDLHMKTFAFGRFVRLARAMKDMGKAEHKENALVLLGDNTDLGWYSDYFMLYSILSMYNKAEKTLVAMGNHDLNWNNIGLEAKASIGLSNYFLRSYNNTANDKPYYQTKIKGYTFIILGDEKPMPDTTATISQAQLNWLNQALKASAVGGKPVFVFLHQPLEHSCEPSLIGVGAQSEAIRAIVEKYKNVFMFNGHLHTKQVVTSIGGVTYVNVPSLLSSGTPGIGYQVEVYANKVLLRTRNFIKGEWIAKDQWEIALK